MLLFQLESTGVVIDRLEVENPSASASTSSSVSNCHVARSIATHHNDQSVPVVIQDPNSMPVDPVITDNGIRGNIVSFQQHLRKLSPFKKRDAPAEPALKLFPQGSRSNEPNVASSTDDLDVSAVEFGCDVNRFLEGNCISQMFIDVPDWREFNLTSWYLESGEVQMLRFLPGASVSF